MAPTREWAVDVKDVTPLVGEAGARRGCLRSKLLFWLSCLLLPLLLLLSVGYWFYWKDVVGMRVMALNTWGMPHTFGSQDKEERVEAISKMISGGGWDLVLLSELWMRPDHATIKTGVEESGLHMTGYDDLTSGCDGTVMPWGCSGLAIVSRSVRLILLFNLNEYHYCSYYHYH